MSYDIKNVIYVGDYGFPLYRFDNRDIVLNSLSGVFSVDVVGNELSVDTYSFTVRYVPDASLVYAPPETEGYLSPGAVLYGLQTVAGRNYMTELPYGTPVFWFTGGDAATGEFVCKGYLQSVDRIGKFAWKLTIVSGVGLLANSYHEGGLYQNTPFADIMADIIGGTWAFGVSQAIEDLPVNGWLPYDTRRNNLHRLLFAAGAALKRGDRYGTDYVAAYLQDDDDPPVIPDARIAISGSVKYTLPANAAEITEHAFFETAADPTETLYDNVSGSDPGEHTVIFDAPCHDLAVTGSLVILRSGVNFAVVSGQGMLTGKKYTHTTKIITHSSGASAAPLIKRVSDNGLISALNSRSVAERVLAYYSSAKAVGAKILRESEECGGLYTFNDPFGEATTGFLQKMTLGVTSLAAAQCEFVEGYTPTGQGNYYNYRVLITASGSWTIPDSIRHIRVVLVAGGAGGDGGYNGEDGRGGDVEDGGDMEYRNDPTNGQRGWQYPGGEQPVARGGAAGNAGIAGKILIIDYDNVTPGDVLNFTVGYLGEGGNVQGGAGSAGGATSMTGAFAATSEDGAVMPNGYLDPISQQIFGAPGKPGYQGGDGGQSDEFNTYAWHGVPGLPGGDCDTYTGGAGGAGLDDDPANIDPNWGPPAGNAVVKASGGGGGGAAYGNNGVPGGRGVLAMPGPSWTNDYVKGGKGGDGANAVSAAPAYYGGGGNGGNGGGGGGSAGGCLYGWEQGDYPVAGAVGAVVETGGKGGAGTAGGDGGAGCVIIYY